MYQPAQQLIKICLIFSIISLFACSALTELKHDLSNKVFGREPVNPPAELDEIQTSYTAQINWTHPFGDSGNFDFTPVLDAGFVYGASAEGIVSKVDASNGRHVWRLNINETISGGVGFGGGLVLVGSNQGNLYAIDVSGKLLWKSRLSSEILSVPRYFDGKVIVRTGDNHIFGIDASDGNKKWIYERTNPPLTLRSSVGIVVDGGAVYAGFAGGKLAAIRADNGKLIWEATVAQPKGVTEIERIADITSLPYVDGPLVYAVAFQGKIAAIDRKNGQVAWNRDISSFTGLTADDGKIYVSHALGSLYSLDYTNGKTFWRQGALAHRRLSTPLAMGDIIAVGDLEGYVHFLSKDEGQFVGRIKVNDKAVMSIIPGTNASQLLVKTRGGALHAVTVK